MFTNNPDGKVVIETDQPLSESLIWDMQRQYFDKEGVNAWVGMVPFFVTSNQLISKKYAECCLAFMKDWCDKNPQAYEQPFYFVELGTGTGQLSYYFLQHLTKMMARAQFVKPLKFIYVMTDFTQHNIDFWSQQDCFKPFLEQGVLDFGLFDMEQDDSITLVNSKFVLKKGSLENPLIVFGNYIFDTVANDAFKAEGNTLHELLLSLETDMDNIDGNHVKSLDQLKHAFNTRQINSKSYYSDSALNSVLEYYQAHINQGHFLIPITGIRSLNRLAEFSDSRMLVLSSDKSFTSLNELEGANEPYIAFHGSFSLDVNFDAMGRYVEYSGGSTLVPTPRDGLRTVAFGFGMDFLKMPIFNEKLYYHLEEFPASSWYLVYRFLKENPENLECKHLVSFLNLSEWDPYIFDKFINELVANIDSATCIVQNELRVGLRRLQDNFYYLPDTFDTYFQAGLCYFHLSDYHRAIEMMQLSIQYFGEQKHSRESLGLCYQALGDNQAAMQYLTD